MWLSQNAVALVQRRPTSCRGSVLSKSRGGEKVKQTFNTTSHEPRSGGLQGDAVYTDLGFCTTTLKDVALQILDLLFGHPLATTLLPPTRKTHPRKLYHPEALGPLCGMAPLLREHIHHEMSLLPFPLHFAIQFSGSVSHARSLPSYPFATSQLNTAWLFH